MSLASYSETCRELNVVGKEVQGKSVHCLKLSWNLKMLVTPESPLNGAPETSDLQPGSLIKEGILSKKCTIIPSERVNNNKSNAVTKEVGQGFLEM